MVDSGGNVGSMKSKKVANPKRPVGRPKGPARRRVHVTLSSEAWAMVDEISSLTGTARASVLSELFDIALPSFAVTIEALRTIRDQPREAQRLVQNFAAESMMKVSQAQLDLDHSITEREKDGRRKRRGRAK